MPEKRLAILSFIVLLSTNLAYSQQEESTSGKQNKNSICILVAHDHISQGIDNGKTQWITVPSWMISYNRHISEKLSVGLHTDIIIEEFFVEDTQSEIPNIQFIERSYPISIVGGATYKPIHYLGIILGGGIEYTKEETFPLIRMGFEPTIAIHQNFEAVFNLSYDLKIEAYDNWNLGAGIAYLF